MVELRSTEDPQLLQQIAAALDEADSVDGSRIALSLDADTQVVLGGAVATAEQASAAGLIAETYADTVRNELRVDPLLRDDPSQLDTAAPQDVDDSSRRGSDLATSEHGGELTGDVGESLEENIPLDPPDEPVMVPTQQEQRGVYDGPVSDEPVADEGPLAPDEAAEVSPSLSDMTQADLERAVHEDHAGGGDGRGDEEQ